MKKIFTLLAGLLLTSGSAFGQAKWQNLVVNGDMEGAQDPKWSSFWCHDYRKGLGDFDPESEQSYQDDDPENGQFRGFAEIVEDPSNPSNHCAKVIIRSDEEAQAAGNRVEADGKLASWDCQFFIYATETIPEGKEVRLTLKIKADKAGSLETQAHWKPGDYNHWQMFGNINYTTEWETYEVSTTVVADQTKESDGKFFQSVAFNLSTMTDGNVIYFDDVKLEIRDPEDPAEFEGWFNFLRKGTLSADKVQGTNYTTFTGRDGIDGIDRQARVVDDPVDGQPALSVTTAYYERSEEKEVLDEEGNPKLDDEGNPTYETVNYWTKKFTLEDGSIKDSVMTRAIDDWESQFFVSIPHTFKNVGTNGEQIKVKYWARADKPTSLDSQAHTNPGGYLHWSFVGSPELTEDWQEFEYEGTVPSEGKGAWTIAFNCNKGKDEPNTIYFRFEEFSVNSAEVKEEERVIASGEAIGEIPVKGSADPLQMKVDLTAALEALGVDKITDLMEGTLKVPFKDENENIVWQVVDPDYLVDENGYNSEQGINIAFNEENSEGNVASFDVYNDNIDATTVSTKLMLGVAESEAPEDGYARRIWNYQLNIRLLAGEAYQQALGVSDLKPAAKTAGVIYDLSGRRVATPAKGLYIQDGKKFIAK